MGRPGTSHPLVCKARQVSFKVRAVGSNLGVLRWFQCSVCMHDNKLQWMNLDRYGIRVSFRETRTDSMFFDLKFILRQTGLTSDA